MRPRRLGWVITGRVAVSRLCSVDLLLFAISVFEFSGSWKRPLLRLLPLRPLHTVFVSLENLVVQPAFSLTIPAHALRLFSVLSFPPPVFGCAQGNGAGTALLAFMFLFSGFFLPYESIPDGWKWFSALSMFKYPYEGMLVNMLDAEEDRGSKSEVSLIS